MEALVVILVFSVAFVGVAAVVTWLLPSGFIHALDDYLIMPLIVGGAAAGGTYWLLDGLAGETAARIVAAAVGLPLVAGMIVLVRVGNRDDEGLAELNRRARQREATYEQRRDAWWAKRRRGSDKS